MDEARRFIANETDRDEDSIEKADPALVGLARFSGVSPNPLALRSIIRTTCISLLMEVVEGWGRLSFVRSATRLLLGISITLKRGLV
jgi:hypothetical protein